MKIKNVIVVCDFANITGGAERVAITSAVSLAETGSNVVMFTGKGPVCDELKNSNVHVICLNQEEAIKTATGCVELSEEFTIVRHGRRWRSC